MEQRKAWLESVLDTAVDGIIVMDASAKVLVFNKACERMFGRNSRDVIGHNVNILMPSDLSEQHDQYLENYYRTGHKKIIGIGREVRGLHADGSQFPLELSVGETTSQGQRQFIGILRDLRPRREMEQRVNQLQGDLVHMARVSAVNEMGAALAHELNQPLTAIMLYLQGLVHALGKHEKPPLNEAEQTILTKAIKETERAGQIIQRMRHFIEKKQSERKIVTLGHLIEDAVELVRLSVRHSVKIDSHYDKNQDVEVDPIQIQQILVNLLRNACEAVQGQQQPWIRIVSNVQDTNITIAITDSGSGIPAQDVPNLFKTFSSQKKNGMGLGLAISRSLAQSHGGDLTVDAGGNGVGATFRLKLPLSQARGYE